MNAQRSPRRGRTVKRRRGVRNATRLPHDDVFVRIQPSPIHGLGVFAIRDIPKDNKIFGDDDETIIRVPAVTVKTLRGWPPS